MKNWMITPDGSAVNLDRVERVTVEMRTAYENNPTTWYVLARFAGQAGTGVTLAHNFADRAVAADWIAVHICGAMDKETRKAMDFAASLFGRGGVKFAGQPDA